MRTTAIKHRHLKLDQKKIDFAKRYFGVDSEQEAIDRALSLLIEEKEILAAMEPLKGSLKGDSWHDTRTQRDLVKPNIKSRFDGGRSLARKHFI